MIIKIKYYLNHYLKSNLDKKCKKKTENKILNETIEIACLLRLVNSYLIDSPQPANISYLWNFGFFIRCMLIIQILTGSFLAMHYQAHVDFAFHQ